MLLGVDVGGTFTDAVLVDAGRIHSAKRPTTPDDQSEGVIEAIEAVLAVTGADPGRVRRFSHGMTVGTNALLERRGARTALIATAGFTDLLEVARQNRPQLYRLCEDRPAPLAPPQLRVGVEERIGPEGTVAELTEAEIERVVAQVADLDPDSAAICLLFSYLDPTHEQALATALRSRLPGLHVSASSEVLAQFREYERCSTTVVDAYLAPLLGRYLERLSERCKSLGIPGPSVMQSSGGVADIGTASRGGAWSVLSGPAGGAVGAGLLAGLSGDGNALGLDMGGTSCDVCVIEGGRVRRTDSREFAGRPIQLPMVDVHTVGAGGGSVAWRDRGGALRVGPRSSGARPGPACYGRGGTEPTVTDANLVLGRLGVDAGLAGGVELDLGAAERAVEGLARQLGLEPLEAAAGIVEVANGEMVRALRVVTVERGVDPRRFSLLPFGGAGPLQAAAIATELGIETILCPRSSGVLSALGLVASERRRDTARTLLADLGSLTSEALAEQVRSLREELDPEPGDAIEATYELRYRGQAFELPVGGSLEPDPGELGEAFAREHERRYGYRDPEGTVELVNLRLAAAGGRDPIELAAPAGEPERERPRRRVHLERSWTEAEVIAGDPVVGLTASGPCVFELPETSLLLPSGWQARVDERGTILARWEPR